MDSSFFNAGQRFRQAVLVHEIAPHQYSALLHDIISDQPDIKPALLDLTTRKVFKELLMRGTPSEKILSKDRLLSELGPLYRDEIIDQLMAFIEGALDLEISTQSEVISTAQEQHAANSPKNSEDQIQELGSFYADNPSRLLFLSIITFGFYTYLWTYRHWRHYKRLALKSKPSLPSRQKDRHIAPFWCASFQPFYIVGAARRVQARLEDLNIKHKPLKPWLVFLLFNLHWITEIPWSPLGFQSTESIATNLVILLFYVFLLYVSVYQQARIQRLANRVLENENYLLQFRSLKAWDYLIITTGVIGTLLICIGALVPPWMVDLFHRQF